MALFAVMHLPFAVVSLDGAGAGAGAGLCGTAAHSGSLLQIACFLLLKPVIASKPFAT